MLILEFKAVGKTTQYSAIDEAIKTVKFIRNKSLRYWMDNKGVGQKGLYSYSTLLRQEFSFVADLNLSACQASVEPTWSAISRSHNTSQDCSNCGQKVQKSLSVRTHVCPHCGFISDRDINAAINILKKALSTVGHTGTFVKSTINAWGEDASILIGSDTCQSKQPL